MLDIKFIRENIDLVKKACEKKNTKIDMDRLLVIDKKRRENQQAMDDMLTQKNKASRAISATKDEKEKKKIILEMKELDKNSDRLYKDLKESEEGLNDLLSQIPNIPFDDVPVGKDGSENVVIAEVGERPKFDFEPKDYLEIAEKLDIIDVKRAAKTSGSRFGFIKKEAALIEFALINFVYDFLVKEGFAPIIPPIMLRPEMARGTGYLEATGESEAYFFPEDKLYMAGTSEQSLVAMHADEILEEKELPKRYLGFSTCFRRESGSYGKDTKGILRVHQFDKIEMFSLSKPEDSKKEHEFFFETEKKLMQLLKIPHRLINICTGDLGFPAAAKYDIEAWLPSENRYRETHSTSNCTDYQARRLNIRYRDKNGKVNFVHTVNGTAFAIGRILIMIIENYQQKDGSMAVPEALQKYLNFKVISR